MYMRKTVKVHGCHGCDNVVCPDGVHTACSTFFVRAAAVHISSVCSLLHRRKHNPAEHTITQSKKKKYEIWNTVFVLQILHVFVLH